MKDADWTAAEKFANDPDCCETLYDERDRPHRKINIEELARHFAEHRQRAEQATEQAVLERIAKPFTDNTTDLTVPPTDLL